MARYGIGGRVMRIAVVGAGGTGGYFGGLLARAGQDVTFIARGAQLDALRTKGLQVKSRQFGTFAVPVKATDNVDEIGPVDLILFCVKAYDTVEAAEAMRPLLGASTMVLSVQNGIDNESRIAAITGKHAVLGAAATVSAQIESPGVIAVTQEPAWIRFGELDGGVSRRTDHLAEIFQAAGFNSDVFPDIRIQMWEKFVFICALSGVTTMMRLPIGPILAHEESRMLFRAVMEEVTAVAHVHGIPLPEDVVDRWFTLSERLNGGVYGSMHTDLVEGRRLELESLNGMVTRLGFAAHVPTPMNFAIYAALKPLADGPFQAPT